MNLKRHYAASAGRPASGCCFGHAMYREHALLPAHGVPLEDAT